MLGTFEMDIDTCIRVYKDMLPEIFPVEYLSGIKVVQFVNAVTATLRFDPAPLEKAVKKLVVEHLKDKAALWRWKRVVQPDGNPKKVVLLHKVLRSHSR